MRDPAVVRRMRGGRQRPSCLLRAILGGTHRRDRWKNDDPDPAYGFYLADTDDFVSGHAATNLGKDFAESFMTLVIEDSFEGDSVAAQKLQFFASYSELVDLREHIRSEFADALGLR